MTDSKPNCLIIAGEKSGEEHCLSFYKDLRALVPEVHFWGVGGDELQNLGMELLYHLKDFSSWGFSEVISKIPFYIKALKKIEREVDSRKCQVAILIDFQDFNLRLAKKLKKKGVKVLYYVAPQAWVWKEWRAEVIGKTVHTLFTILPFEKKWFSDRGVKCTKGVPHPIWFTYKKSLQLLNSSSCEDFNKELKILLLPGSRTFEIENLLPLFYEACLQLKKKFSLKISLVYSPNVKKENYSSFLDIVDNIYRNDELEMALIDADIAIASSGTVTLTTALFEVPTVVCYKTSLFNELIAKVIVDYDGPISLCNIVHEKGIFPEFIQKNTTVKNIVDSVLKWAEDCNAYESVKKDLKLTKDLIKGDEENISNYIGEIINSTYEI